jgi:hypothetical protein
LALKGGELQLASDCIQGPTDALSELQKDFLGDIVPKRGHMSFKSFSSNPNFATIFDLKDEYTEAFIKKRLLKLKPHP